MGVGGGRGIGAGSGEGALRSEAQMIKRTPL